MASLLKDFSGDHQGTVFDQVRRMLSRMDTAVALLGQALAATDEAINQANQEGAMPSTVQSLAAQRTQIADSISQVARLHELLEQRIQQAEQQEQLTAKLQRLTEQLNELALRARNRR
jgi:hypothetical protein